MAPTEETILTAFLLSPASLTEIFTFQSFASHFPKAQQSSPEIKRLYRSLQHRRALISDTVAQNIDNEVERGNAQRQVVVRARRAAEKQEPDEEIAIEKAVSKTGYMSCITLIDFEPALRVHFKFVFFETTQAIIHSTKPRSRHWGRFYRVKGIRG